MIRNCIFILLLSLGFAGCKKGELEKNVEYRETTFVYNEQVSMVFEGPGLLDFDIPWVPITIEEQGDGSVSDPLVAAVEKITLKSMKITIVDPSDGTFYFLKDLVVHVSKGNLPEQELAHHYNISDDIGNVLFMQPSNTLPLDEYVKDGEYGMRMVITTKDLLPASVGTITLLADMQFDVTLTNEPKN